jgi:GNAT superfamily N-acetyltransferase
METIEAATVADIPQLANLLTLLFTQEVDFRPDRAKQERGLRLLIESPSTGVVFVAREGNEVVGMVSLLFTISTAEGGPACWLEDMVVRPDRRGDGIGNRLLQHAIDYARIHGFSRITLLTDKVNAGAIRFYERHGFVESAMTALRLDLKSS